MQARQVSPCFGRRILSLMSSRKSCGSTGRYWRIHACPRESLQVHLDGGSTRVPRGSSLKFLSRVGWVWRASSAGLLQLKEVLLFAWSGPRGSHSSLQVHPKAMWPNCVARVHAGPRRSERGSREGSPVLDVGGNSSIASFLRRSFAGLRGSVRALRGSWSYARPTRPLRRLGGPFISTRVLEEVGERVYIIESRGMLMLTCVVYDAALSALSPRRSILSGGAGPRGS